MNRLDSEATAQFTQPIRQIVLMVIVLCLVGALGYVALPTVAPIFFANPWLNGVIAAVFVFGVLACFWQLWQLIASVSWIEGFVGERPGHQFTHAPRLLASLAALLRARGARAQLGPSSTRSILDSVATRIDEARDITRYIVNVLIFLGLLGTFYGLATTVPAVVDTIRSLAPSGQEGQSATDVFSNLISGLESQLGGMGVAFASSLLGLAGSLVVGLLELFATHGQNKFYRDLEDWLSTITRVGVGSEGGEGGVVGELLDHMAEQIDALTAIFEASDQSRGVVDDRLRQLTGSVESLVKRIEGESEAANSLSDLAQSQERMSTTLQEQANAQSDLARAIREAMEHDDSKAAPAPAPEAPSEPDGEARMRLRSMDVQLLRILEEMATGRQEMLDDLRAEIRHLTRAVETLGREER